MIWDERRDGYRIVAPNQLSLMEVTMQKPHDNSKACPTALEQDSTLIVVVELSLSNWLVAGMIPGNALPGGDDDGPTRKRRPPASFTSFSVFSGEKNTGT